MPPPVLFVYTFFLHEDSLDVGAYRRKIQIILRNKILEKPKGKKFRNMKLFLSKDKEGENLNLKKRECFLLTLEELAYLEI